MDLHKEVLDLLETVLRIKFSCLMLCPFYKTLDKFLIMSDKKIQMRVTQFVDCEEQTADVEFFGLQVRKNGREKYHLDLYVRKHFSKTDTEVMRLPNFSQERESLTDIFCLLESIFVKKAYERNVNMKVLIR